MIPDPLCDPSVPNRYRDRLDEIDKNCDPSEKARSIELDAWLEAERTVAKAQSHVLLIGQNNTGSYQIFMQARLADEASNDARFFGRLGPEVAQRMFDKLLRVLVISMEKGEQSLSSHATEQLRSLQNLYDDYESLHMSISQEQRVSKLEDIIIRLHRLWNDTSITRILANGEASEINALSSFYEGDLLDDQNIKANDIQKAFAYIPCQKSIICASLEGPFAKSPLIDEVIYEPRDAKEVPRLRIVHIGGRVGGVGGDRQKRITNQDVRDFDSLIVVIPVRAVSQLKNSTEDFILETLERVEQALKATDNLERGTACCLLLNTQPLKDATATMPPSLASTLKLKAKERFPMCDFLMLSAVDSENQESTLMVMDKAAGAIAEYKSKAANAADEHSRVKAKEPVVCTDRNNPPPLAHDVRSRFYNPCLSIAVAIFAMGLYFLSLRKEM